MHTPTPWKQGKDFFGKPCTRIETIDETAVANAAWQLGIDYRHSVANAAFIVHACNSHTDLLEALEAINAVFITHTNNQINIDWIRSKIGQAIAKARDA